MKYASRNPYPYLPVQITMTRQVCLYLLSQWVIVLIGSIIMRHFFPHIVDIFTGHLLVDLGCYVVAVVASVLIICQKNMIPFVLRIITFFFITLLTGYVLGVEYNVAMQSSPRPASTERIFIFSWVFSASLLIASVFLVPFLLRFVHVFQWLSIIAFTCLLVITIVCISISPVHHDHIARYFRISIAMAFTMFLVILFSNIVVIVNRCHKVSSPECDALQGATTLYMDTKTFFSSTPKQKKRQSRRRFSKKISQF